MIKRICDKCGDEIKSKEIPCIEFGIWSLCSDGSKDSSGNCKEFEVCEKCYKKILGEFK